MSQQGWTPPPGAGGPGGGQGAGGYGPGPNQGYGGAPQMPSFYLSRMGVEEGPYTFYDLQQQAKAGYIRSMSMVRRTDGGSWFMASEIPGVFSDKDWLTALLLSFFAGSFGVDRFYLGYVGLGVIKLITLGACGIWTIIDFILIALNNVPDSNGLPLKRT